jgi:hypothetical protein
MISFAYSRRAPLVGGGPGTAGLFAATLLLSASLGCTAGVKPTQTGTPGAAGTTGTTVLGSAGSTGAGGTQVAGTAGTFGSSGTGGTAFVTNPDAAACQQYDVMFVPKTPTVYLLVDRSGSMFHCLSGNTGDAICADPANTSWSNLKTAMESVMTQLDAQVRFGFSTVWGANPTGGGMCPSLNGMTTNDVAPALNNAAKIKTMYDGLAFPPNSTQVGIKFESPASESIAAVTKELSADPTPGDKYIIFLTDGQPDYCDDSNSLCAPDSVVYRIQKAHDLNITTIVLGLQTTLFDLGQGILQAFANAGAGEPTVAPIRMNGTANDFYDQCAGVAGWAADLKDSMKPAARGTTLGTYSATMGPTKPYMPDAANQAQLVSQLSAALAGVKSCSFDLGGHIKVNTKLLDKASVLIGGNPVPLDPDNGWGMSSETVLELKGAACDSWRKSDANDIKFNFPCEIIVT